MAFQAVVTKLLILPLERGWAGGSGGRQDWDPTGIKMFHPVLFHSIFPHGMRAPICTSRLIGELKETAMGRGVLMTWTGIRVWKDMSCAEG